MRKLLVVAALGGLMIAGCAKKNDASTYDSTSTTTSTGTSTTTPPVTTPAPGTVDNSGTIAPDTMHSGTGTTHRDTMATPPPGTTR